MPMQKLDILAAGFSSVFNGEMQVFSGGPWATANDETGTAVALFARPVNLGVVRLDMAGSDMTAHRSEISLDVLQMDNAFDTIFSLKNCGINRGAPGTMSQDNPNPPQMKAGYREDRGYIDPLVKVLNRPRLVKGIRLQIAGHGWQAARDMQMFGHVTADGPLWTRTSVHQVLSDLPEHWVVPDAW